MGGGGSQASGSVLHRSLSPSRPRVAPNSLIQVTYLGRSAESHLIPPIVIKINAFDGFIRV